MKQQKKSTFGCLKGSVIIKGNIIKPLNIQWNADWNNIGGPNPKQIKIFKKIKSV